MNSEKLALHVFQAASTKQIARLEETYIINFETKSAHLQELTRSALLVHSSWRDLLTTNEFWKRRLSVKLPTELKLYLDRRPACWAQRAQEHFNRNLLTNPEFKSQGIESAALIGTIY